MKHIPRSSNSTAQPPPKDARLPVRDMAHALSVAGGSQQLADKLFLAFLRELPQQLETMRRQAADNDREALWDTAHRMHGSTALCGVPALNRVVSELEHAIKSATPGEIDQALRQVASEVDRLQRSQPACTE